MTKLEDLDIFKLMQRLETFEKTDIEERLGYIEKQMKHFVYAASEMRDKFANGISVSMDTNSLNIATAITNQMERSINLLRSEVIEIRTLRKEIEEQFKKESVTGALKYMAKQLLELKQDVHTIKEEGLKKQIHLDLTMDGYEMVKRKPPTTNPILDDDPIDEEKATKALLDTLLEREKKVLIHRFGLFGEKAKTFVAIGKSLNVTGSRVSNICAKALRKCRHPSRRDLAEDLTHKEFRVAILGE